MYLLTAPVCYVHAGVWADDAVRLQILELLEHPPPISEVWHLKQKIAIVWTCVRSKDVSIQSACLHVARITVATQQICS